jgi:hypothetical protein
MFEGILYALIGNWGRAVIGWALENPVPVSLGFALWLSVFFLGKVQLKMIREKTEAWILTSSREILKKSGNITVEQLYKQLLPQWEQNVRGTALFIPHRWEIWPVPATPRFVKKRINFTPEWLGGFLWANGIKLPGARAPEKEEGPSYLPKVPK